MNLARAFHCLTLIGVITLAVGCAIAPTPTATLLPSRTPATAEPTQPPPMHPPTAPVPAAALMPTASPQCPALHPRASADHCPLPPRRQRLPGRGEVSWKRQ
jgi:hypothetical protein